jgi:hypothetical protein
MIHQFIFAAPKPGMSVSDFQAYWVEKHAVQFASKITQIKKYVVNTTVPLLGHDYHWFGCGEIWIKQEEQVPSLQSDAFLKGARLDEPNWAAFWQTLVVDTDSHDVIAGPAETTSDIGVKIIAVFKRKDGTTLASFRKRAADSEFLGKALPGLIRFKQGLTRDGAYGLSEAAMDAVTVMWFESIDAAVDALSSPAGRAYEAELNGFVDRARYHRMAFQEHWIIGPEPRA